MYIVIQKNISTLFQYLATLLCLLCTYLSICIKYYFLTKHNFKLREVLCVYFSGKKLRPSEMRKNRKIFKAIIIKIIIIFNQS